MINTWFPWYGLNLIPMCVLLLFWHWFDQYTCVLLDQHVWFCLCHSYLIMRCAVYLLSLPHLNNYGCGSYYDFILIHMHLFHALVMVYSFSIHIWMYNWCPYVLISWHIWPLYIYMYSWCSSVLISWHFGLCPSTHV